MKVNKIATLVCLLFVIGSGLSIYLLRNLTIAPDIFIGLFTGFIASLAIAVINYFVERERILNSIDSGIKDSYINIIAISKIMAQILPTIHTASDISGVQFKNAYSISLINSRIFEETKLELYSPFFKNDKLKACEELKMFKNEVYNIKNMTANLEIQVFEYRMLYLKTHDKKISGQTVTPDEQDELDKKRNLVHKLTSELQEYTEKQAVELGNIATKFFRQIRNKNRWNDIKKELLPQVKIVVMSSLFDNVSNYEA